MILGASLVDGEVAIDAREPPDVLRYYLALHRPGAAEGPVKRLDFQLRSLSRDRATFSSS
jgi:hypothetical protein